MHLDPSSPRIKTQGRIKQWAAKQGFRERLILLAQWVVWHGGTNYTDTGAGRKPRSGMILPLPFTRGKGQDQNLTSRDKPRMMKRGTGTE